MTPHRLAKRQHKRTRKSFWRTISGQSIPVLLKQAHANERSTDTCRRHRRAEIRRIALRLPVACPRDAGRSRKGISASHTRSSTGRNGWSTIPCGQSASALPRSKPCCMTISSAASIRPRTWLQRRPNAVPITRNGRAYTYRPSQSWQPKHF
jgi:hypothetical protein